MSNHKDPIPTYFTEDYMASILKKHFNSTIQVHEMSSEPGSAVGDNYMCQIWRIKLNLTVEGTQKALSIIAKVTPNTKAMDSVKELVDVFDNEASVFAVVLPAIQKHLRNIPDFTPECYHVHFEKKVIFMEDLKSSGFVLQPRGVFLNFEQCKIVVKALAAFHGGSYHAELENPGFSERYKKTLWDGEISDMMSKFCRNTQQMLEKYVKTYGLSDDYENKLLKFEETVLNGGLKVLKFNPSELNFLQHGDCWMNNMLFRYTENGLESVKLLDYQIVYYGSFANDLNYFLFSSASSDVILEQLDNLLEIYHEELKSIAPEIPDLSFESIRNEFYTRLYFGFMLSLSFRSVIVGDVPPDMDQVLDGGGQEMGFGSDRFREDLRKFLPFFEKNGVF